MAKNITQYTKEQEEEIVNKFDRLYSQFRPRIANKHDIAFMKKTRPILMMRKKLEKAEWSPSLRGKKTELIAEMDRANMWMLYYFKHHV